MRTRIDAPLDKLEAAASRRRPSAPDFSHMTLPEVHALIERGEAGIAARCEALVIPTPARPFPSRWLKGLGSNTIWQKAQA